MPPTHVPTRFCSEDIIKFVASEFCPRCKEIIPLVSADKQHTTTFGNGGFLTCCGKFIHAECQNPDGQDRGRCTLCEEHQGQWVSNVVDFCVFLSPVPDIPPLLSRM